MDCTKRHRLPYLLINNGKVHACMRCAHVSANDSLLRVHVSSTIVVNDFMCNPAMGLTQTDVKHGQTVVTLKTLKCKKEKRIENVFFSSLIEVKSGV